MPPFMLQIHISLCCFATNPVAYDDDNYLNFMGYPSILATYLVIPWVRLHCAIQTDQLAGSRTTCRIVFNLLLRLSSAAALPMGRTLGALDVDCWDDEVHMLDLSCKLQLLSLPS